MLAIIGLGSGKRILDRFGQAPEHPLDAMALALPLGMGLMALGTLVLGELGWLNRVGLSVLLAVWMEMGLCPAFRLLRELGRRIRTRDGDCDRSAASRVLAFCLGSTLLGTALVATGPVTDGDALCYHLQVPKEFLMHEAVGFDPDLHETVYPLVTELIYLPALEFRGPVACRWIQWVAGPGAVRQRDGAGASEPGPPRLVGRGDRPAGPGDLQWDVGPAQRRGAGRIRDGRDLRLGPVAGPAERCGGGRRGRSLPGWRSA